jgi:phenylpropionate dioxygenase-like ring-hydroxylating dioxygenase large terminal subunit
MTSVVPSRYEALIEPERVHASLYTDQEIFAEELRKICYRTWVVVGHESEVSQPNDYVRKKLGMQDVIMTRDRDGQIHLLLNRCSHRGNQVCDDAKGNSGTFRCPYHGWTFRNTGELVGFPFFKGYGERKLDMPMGRVPRVDSYGGFVFGSFAPEGPSLLEHLGAAAGEIDRRTRLSPEGEVALNAGWLQHQTRANWKLLAENETDGYHPQFVHSDRQGPKVPTGRTGRADDCACLNGSRHSKQADAINVIDAKHTLDGQQVEVCRDFQHGGHLMNRLQLAERTLTPSPAHLCGDLGR